VTPAWLTLDDLRKLDEREHLMATQPKPKPKPEPEPPEPKPEEDDAAHVEPFPGSPDDMMNRLSAKDALTDRVDAIFASQVALIERVDKLEERINAPPVGIGRRP
jgi:hypothetical protein